MQSYSTTERSSRKTVSIAIHLRVEKTMAFGCGNSTIIAIGQDALSNAIVGDTYVFRCCERNSSDL